MRVVAQATLEFERKPIEVRNPPNSNPVESKDKIADDEPNGQDPLRMV